MIEDFCIMSSPLVSVIIPAYNVEKYINTCLQSVLSQTYTNLEIIIINDGSTDDTLSIAEHYAKYDSRITIYSKKNGGLCSAKNYGLSHCTGEFIVFVDSDDYLEKDYVFQLIKQSTGRKDELIMCDFLANGIKEHKDWGFLEINNKEDVFSCYIRGGICNRTVNKLYPHAIIDGLSFPDGRDMLEDAFFTSHVLERCNHFIRIDYAGYNYIRHSGSLTKSYISPKKLAEKYVNTLEKDFICLKNTRHDDLMAMSEIAMRHTKKCFYSVIDLNVFNIYKSIISISCLFKTLDGIDKKTRKFFLPFSKCKCIKELKHCFLKYIILYGSFKDKMMYFRSRIRMFIKKY